MAALPYMQLYVAEYLADTCHLNAAQHGAYLLLLMNYWQRGKALPDVNDRLAIVARMTNEEWTANREVVAEFFQISNGVWIHARVERDLLKVKGVSEAGRIAGIASGKARKERVSNDRSTNVTESFNETSTKEEPLRRRTEADTEQKHKTALARSVPPEELAGTLPLVDGTEYLISKSQIQEWTAAYPGINVRTELLGFKAWLNANPTRKKTPKGICRAIIHWLSGAQNKSQGLHNKGATNGKSADRAFETAANLIFEIENHHGAHAGELLPGGGTH